ncbi:hypothetical protein ABPG77_001932 [Micractinium sp. CCAP 211/92]
MQTAVCGDAQHELPSLLHLPNVLLAHIIGHLSDLSDLAAAAATCAALHRLIADATWQRVSQCAVHLQQLDLAGATALGDADLLPLRQLSALTSLSLAGLWRVTGSSSRAVSAATRRRSGAAQAAPPAARGGHAQRAQQLDVLAPILGSNRGLLRLDISGTSVPVGPTLAAAVAQLTEGAPNATKPAYGLQRLRLAGCGRAAGGQQAALLGRVLAECPALVALDASGCRWLTLEGLEGEAGDALWAALGMLPLRHVSFAGCELLGGLGTLVSSWENLISLDLSGTAVDDADVQLIGVACDNLRTLNLSACCRIKEGLLPRSSAVLFGQLSELRLGDLAWVGPQHLAPVLRELSLYAGAPLRLDLSGCGGLSDSALLEMLEAGGPAHGVEELRLGSSSWLTTAVLQRLAAATRVASTPAGAVAVGASGGAKHGSTLDGSGRSKPLLQGLRVLDLSHLQCLGSKTSTAAAAAAAATLAALLAAAGSSLRTLLLDGCFAGGAADGSRLLPLLARCCPGLEALSLVGCTGMGDDDLAALSTLRGLRDLAVGGASLAWLENRALTGLRGLTRLRIARRPFLTDAQLAPVLAANRGSLAQLELAGCASLTDAALLHLLPASEGAADSRTATQGEAAADQPELGATAEAALPQARNSREAAGADHLAPQRASLLPGLQPLQQSEAQQQREARLLLPLPRPAAPQLTHLQLVCCDRVRGGSLRHLGCLRSLRLGGCPSMDEAAVQAAVLCLTRLTLLELPGHIPASSMPVVPAGAARHLRGLRLLGGGEERRGGRWG